MVAQVEVPARSDPGSGSDQAIEDSAAVARAIEAHGAERVIIAPGGADEDQVLHCIRLVTALGVKVSVLPRLLEVVGSSSVFDDVDGLTLLGVRQFGLSKSSRFLKRAMDIAGAACGLFLLAPLFVLVAVAIKLDSRGPVFFVQTRIGRREKRFAMVKFRSMVPGADRLKDQIRHQNEVEGGLFKIAADPRVTKMGRLLRQTSLDELPQLFNVLRGDMSLVGPRPLVLDEDALIEGWQRRRLAVKPGMTGLWQIFGSSRIPMPEMVKIDYLYGANWSVWLDLKILLRTVPHVLARRGL
jgi:exopolysaccharide biosynthesis polyprenyl glycosylphosphotransferase